MAEKIGAGDEPQTYDTENGRYGSKGYDSRNDESIKRAYSKSKIKNALSSSQWKRYYNRLSEIRYGESVETLSNGDYIIPLHKANDKELPVLIISSANYIKPRVKLVLHFENDNMLDDLLNRWKNDK